MPVADEPMRFGSPATCGCPENCVIALDLQRHNTAACPLTGRREAHREPITGVGVKTMSQRLACDILS